MNIAIILNGISRKKHLFYKKIFPVLSANFALQVFETTSKNHAFELSAAAVKENYDVILSAGGDGTLHQVLNGALSVSQTHLPMFGLIPLGTGNDFARTCRLKSDASQILGLLQANNPKPTDVATLTSRDSNGKDVFRYFINCCSLGMGPDVVRRLENNDRNTGPTHTYISAIVKTFFTQHPPVVTCSAEGWHFHGKVRVLALANGKSFGRAVYLAPDALPDDGLLNLFIARDVPTIRFLIYLHLLKARLKLRNKSVVYRTLREVVITSAESCALEAEGELAGFLPASIGMLHHHIKFLR